MQWHSENRVASVATHIQLLNDAFNVDVSADTVKRLLKSYAWESVRGGTGRGGGQWRLLKRPIKSVASRRAVRKLIYGCMALLV